MDAAYRRAPQLRVGLTRCEMHSSTKKIKKIHSVFSASAPLETPDNFIGRTKEKQSIIRSLYAQGRHVVVHGERGVGKSSLLNVVTKEFADSEKYIRVRHICTSEDTFDEILFTYLHETGQSYESSPARERTTRHLDSRLKVVAAEGGVKSSKEKEISHTPVLDSSVSPHSLASRYCKRPALFVIDEFDRVVSDHTKNQLSQFIKVLDGDASTDKYVLISWADILALLGALQCSICPE